MKPIFKLLILLCSFVFICALSSCKNYTCRCVAYNTQLAEPLGESSYTVKKRDRTRLCSDKSTQPDSYGNYTQCTIK